MGGAVLEGPALHRMGHAVGYVQVEILALAHSLLQLPVDILRQTQPHGFVIEHETTEIGRDIFHTKNLQLIPEQQIATELENSSILAGKAGLANREETGGAKWRRTARDKRDYNLAKE